MTACPVEANCRAATHCPYCIQGSEYQAIDRRVLFPAEVERKEARRVAQVLHRMTPEYRTGKRSAHKGRRLEQELARLVEGHRVPLSGALEGLPNDVVARNGWRLESKGRADLFGTIYRWLGESDVVAFREIEAGGPWLFGCRLDWMMARLGEPDAPGADRLIAAVEGVRRSPASVVLPGGEPCVVHRTKGGFTLMRRWLAAEDAAVLCLKADRRGWVSVMDADHMTTLLPTR